MGNIMAISFRIHLRNTSEVEGKTEYTAIADRRKYVTISSSKTKYNGREVGYYFKKLKPKHSQQKIINNI
jgi:hypothetical protein